MTGLCVCVVTKLFYYNTALISTLGIEYNNGITIRSRGVCTFWVTIKSGTFTCLCVTFSRHSQAPFGANSLTVAKINRTYPCPARGKLAGKALTSNMSDHLSLALILILIQTKKTKPRQRPLSVNIRNSWFIRITSIAR
mgnify:CR=1 FL=1